MRAAIALALLCAACTLQPPRAEETCPSPPGFAAAGGGLRDLAGARLRIGSALDAYPLQAFAPYREAAAREFDLATPENELKWGVLHPGPDRFNFCPADSIAAFARDHGMQLRGHTLVWGERLPDWLTRTGYSREELVELLHAHIRTVIGHYRAQFPGLIRQWDVVNEAVADCEGPQPCGLKHNFWFRALGPEYVELAFRFAREADPDAKLFYNDYGTEMDTPAARAKRDGVLRLLTALRGRQVPVDGVGLQYHVVAGLPLANAKNLLRRYAAAGLEIAVTEMDVTTGSDSPDAAMFRQQARTYRAVLDACLGQPACRTFASWGFTDAVSWRKPDPACLLDAEYRPKPAYQALRARLQSAGKSAP